MIEGPEILGASLAQAQSGSVGNSGFVKFSNSGTGLLGSEQDVGLELGHLGWQNLGRQNNSRTESDTSMDDLRASEQTRQS